MNFIPIIYGLVDLAIGILGKAGVLKGSNEQKVRDIVDALEKAAQEVISRADALRAIAKQSAELTATEEAALDKKMADAFAQAKWQPTD